MTTHLMVQQDMFLHTFIITNFTTNLFKLYSDPQHLAHSLGMITSNFLMFVTPANIRERER